MKDIFLYLVGSLLGTAVAIAYLWLFRKVFGASELNLYESFEREKDKKQNE